MTPIKVLLPLVVLCMAITATSFAQSTVSPEAADSYVVEITYFKGRPLAYQKIGGWAWYALFDRVADWKPKARELPVDAVQLSTRDEAGVVKVKVTVLRGRNHEIEDLVGEYPVGQTKIAIQDLTRFGVVPFEVKLVRASTGVPDLPTIKNDTTSLVVSVEPANAKIPSFKARYLNSSSKPVMAVAFRTTINGATKLIGMPQEREGKILIAPGAVYGHTIRYPVGLITESTGDLPESQRGLQLNIMAVVFADGTYEGDKVSAARYRGYKMGEKIQLSRILALLKSPAAASSGSLGAKLDTLSYRIEPGDIAMLATEFPGLSAAAMEILRSCAEVSASDVQKQFRSTFGSGSTIRPDGFDEAVKEAIVKCEDWIGSIP
jgi:hypothetical protein